MAIAAPKQICWSFATSIS